MKLLLDTHDCLRLLPRVGKRRPVYSNSLTAVQDPGMQQYQQELLGFAEREKEFLRRLDAKDKLHEGTTVKLRNSLQAARDQARLS